VTGRWRFERGRAESALDSLAVQARREAKHSKCFQAHKERRLSMDFGYVSLTQIKIYVGSHNIYAQLYA